MNPFLELSSVTIVFDHYDNSFNQNNRKRAMRFFWFTVTYVSDPGE